MGIFIGSINNLLTKVNILGILTQVCINLGHYFYETCSLFVHHKLHVNCTQSYNPKIIYCQFCNYKHE